MRRLTPVAVRIETVRAAEIGNRSICSKAAGFIESIRPSGKKREGQVEEQPK
jgi:hypothetical protein